MVQMRVQVKGMDFGRMADQVGMEFDELKRNTLTSMAELIASTSPVDSGYYARNHEVALRSGSFAATETRPEDAPRRSKGQAVDEAAARAAGFASMLAGINSRSMDSPNFVFRNRMAYSGLVEAEHAVYARARMEVPAAIESHIQTMLARLP